MEKRHDNLMRTIRTDLKNLETPEKYYKEDTYTDGKGKVRECFQVSLDGCQRLSNKLKGEVKEEFLIAVGLRLKTAQGRQIQRLRVNLRKSTLWRRRLRFWVSL